MSWLRKPTQLHKENKNNKMQRTTACIAPRAERKEYPLFVPDNIQHMNQQIDILSEVTLFVASKCRLELRTVYC